MLWLLTLLSAASAEPSEPVGTTSGAAAAPAQSFADTLPPAPTAAEVEAWEAVDYNDYLVDTHIRWSDELSRRLREAGRAGPQGGAGATLRPIAGFARAARAHAAAVPPYRGDAAFRDAIVSIYDILATTIERDLPAFWSIITKPDVRNADVVEAERRYLALQADCDRADQLMRTAQADFARKHGYVLVSRAPEPERVADRRPAFTAPGLPPAGSVLPAVQHVNFALRYNNALVARQAALTQAYNTVLAATDGDADALERARVDGLATIRGELELLRAAEAWQGDDGLRAATIAYGTALEDMLRDLAPYTALRRKTVLTEAEAATFTRIEAALGPRARTANEDFRAAQEGFLTRWGVHAFEAWQKANGDATATGAGTAAP